MKAPIVMLPLLARLASASAEIDDEIKSRLACELQGDQHMYDLRDLQGEHAYFLPTEQPNQNLYFNFCKQLSEDEFDIAEDWCRESLGGIPTYAYLKDSAA